MRTSDFSHLRELPYPLAPGATPRIVKPDLVRAVRRRAFLYAALYTRCAVFTVATPTVRAVLGLRAVVVCSARFGRAEQQGAPADDVPASHKNNARSW
jgi:hypothetical protein